MPMGRCMMVNGRMDPGLGMENGRISVVSFTKAFGSRVFKMDMGQ